MHTLLIKKEWTRQSILDAHEVGGRKKGRTAGGWVDELAAQKKVITLCPLCTGKFNPGKVGYRKEKEYPFCTAKCDGCSVTDTKCSMYIYGELYTQVRSTADERREWARQRQLGIERGQL
jgi:hypothetical protein